MPLENRIVMARNVGRGGALIFSWGVTAKFNASGAFLIFSRFLILKHSLNWTLSEDISQATFSFQYLSCKFARCLCSN